MTTARSIPEPRLTALARPAAGPPGNLRGATSFSSVRHLVWRRGQSLEPVTAETGKGYGHPIPLPDPDVFGRIRTGEDEIYLVRDAALSLDDIDGVPPGQALGPPQTSYWFRWRPRLTLYAI